MSTRLNVTYNLFGLSNALGLEKQAAQLLRNSIKGFMPGADTVRSMQKLVAKAPRARSGALSPTKMVTYMYDNSSKFPGFANASPAKSFAELVRDKAVKANYSARKALERYAGRISSGEVDALNPATLKRMDQLHARRQAIWEAFTNANNRLWALKNKG